METTLQMNVGRLLNLNLAPNKLCLSESTLCLPRRIKQKEASRVRKYHLVRDLFGDDFPRGQIHLDDSTECPILAGICAETQRRLSCIRRQAPCVTTARGALALRSSRIGCSFKTIRIHSVHSRPILQGD